MADFIARGSAPRYASCVCLMQMIYCHCYDRSTSFYQLCALRRRLVAFDMMGLHFSSNIQSVEGVSPLISIIRVLGLRGSPEMRCHFRFIRR